MRHRIRISITVPGINSLLGLMGYAAIDLDTETIMRAMDNAKYLAERYGWEEFEKAFHWYEEQYGKVLDPTELVLVFTEQQELTRFNEYWEN